MIENDLTTDLIVLDSHIQSLFDSIRKGNAMIKEFQSFEMRLFNKTNLSALIEFILENAKAVFDLEQITLCLLDESGNFNRLLGDDVNTLSDKQNLPLLYDAELLKEKFGYFMHTYIGPFDRENFGKFFPTFAVLSGVAIIPLGRRGKYYGTLNFGSRRDDHFTGAKAKDCLAFLGLVVSICFENLMNVETIRSTSFIDTLTGVNNRRFLEQRIGEELDRCRRNNDPLTCLFLDIDHFKSVNDKYGHLAGDRVLASVAAAVKNLLRSNDVLVRYGGEEFISLLTGISQNTGFDIAERIRMNIQALNIAFNDIVISVTVSIGLSTFRINQSSPTSSSEMAELLIEAADAALYRAKRNGRNCCEYGDIQSKRISALSN